MSDDSLPPTSGRTESVAGHGGGCGGKEERDGGADLSDTVMFLMMKATSRKIQCMDVGGKQCYQGEIW